MTNGLKKAIDRVLPLLRFYSVQMRLVVLFSLLCTAILVATELALFFGIPLTGYEGTVGQYRSEACRNLLLIADLKEERLRCWMSERRSDFATLADDFLKVSALKSLCSGARQRLAAGGRDELAAWLRQNSDGRALAAQLQAMVKLSLACSRVFVADAASGIVLVSADESDCGADVRDRPCFAEALKTSGQYIEDIHVGRQGGDLVLDISQTVRDASQDPLAVLVAEFRAGELLHSIVYTGEGPGAEGETLLVNRDQKNLTTLKHPLPDGSRPGPLTYQIAAEPAALAARGERGVVEANDYRGAAVLAVCRRVEVAPGIGWGLVVKMDRADLFAHLRRNALALLAIAGIGVGGVLLLTMAVARAVTRPVRALEQAASAVAQGDFTARVPVDGVDEVGALGVSFNSMVDQIERDRATILRQERLAAIGQLTATVSHEIRNPLGTIRTSFFVLAGQLRDQNPALTETFKRIDRSIARCDAIIADLLDYSRVHTLERKSTDIDAWLEVTLNEQEIPAGITLQRDLASAARLEIDRERFRRVMLNLLSNACQAMQPGGGRLTVTSHCEAERLVIGVADSGCGIAEDQIDRLFEPLYSTKSFGLGLGLPIVKQIIQQHGGDVSVSSQVGRGTTVVFWLPMPAGEGCSS